MQISQDFLLKNRLAVMRLSRDLLSTQPDEQLQTVDYYVETISVSRGTVQKAMQFLIDRGCVSTHFRGHLGTFLLTKDDEQLWEYSGWGTLAGAMALPLNKLVSGLATGICACIKIESIPFNCVFIQGSRTRMNGLKSGKFDFVVASRLTEKVLLHEYDMLESIVSLPGCAYGGKYILIFADPKKSEIEDGMTVAVDPTSVDQYYLTQKVCEGKNYIKFYETTYIDTRFSVKRGESDVSVSRIDVLETLGMGEEHVKELVIPEFTKKEIESFTNTVILARKDNYGLKRLLNQTLRASIVSNSQKKVVSGAMPPSYY